METPERQQPEWLAVYTKNSILAHQKRQANDHAGAKKLFEEALQFIEDQKLLGKTDERMLRCEITLHQGVFDCHVQLQSAPWIVLRVMHQYGEYLRQMMADFAETDQKFAGIKEIFTNIFTATDINQLHAAVKEFERIIADSEVELTPEQLAKMGMFYLFLNKFYETSQLFFGFSTMMIEEGEECKERFRETADRTIQIFNKIDEDFLKQHDLQKYKDYVNTWFGIYADIMDATYALDVKDHVFDSNWAFQEKDIEMLWKIVERELAEEGDDDAVNQMKQNAAVNAMEKLMDVYYSEALMNIDNYERALKNMDKIVAEAKRLKDPTKVLFENHLKRAIIARKYLLDMSYNEGLVLSQLNPVSFFNRKKLGSEETAVAGTQYEDTALADIEFSRAGNFTFSEQTTEAIGGLADRPPALSIPDEEELALISAVQDFMPTNVYEQTEARSRELRKDEKFKEWEKIFIQQLKADLEFAQIYRPDHLSAENHKSQKWLSILEARLLLYEYFQLKDEDNDEKPEKDFKDRILELLGDDLPSAKLDRIEELLLVYAEKPKGTYFRQIVEIYIILGWVYIEKSDYSKSKHYLCEAFNMLKDLGDDSHTLHNELRRAYARLKSLESSDSQIPTLDRDAREYRKSRWNEAFCEILASGDLSLIIEDFEEKAKRFVPQIAGMNIFKDNSSLPTGSFVKNDIANGGMYKTVVKVPQNKNQVLGIQSELPMPDEVVALLPEFLLHILNLREIRDFRTQLETTDDEKLKAPLKKIILAKAAKIALGIIPEAARDENALMRSKFFNRLVESKNLEFYFTINSEYAESLAILSSLDIEVAEGMLGRTMIEMLENDPHASELSDILAVSRKLADFYMKEIKDGDSEEEHKIKQFLSYLIDNGFTSEFIEFVQAALYPEERADFIFEL